MSISILLCFSTVVLLNTYINALQCGKIELYKRKVVGGSESTKNYPWIASLMYKNEAKCAGSLISSKYVITAAHCFLSYDLNNIDKLITIVFGVYNRCLPLEKNRQSFIPKQVYFPDKLPTTQNPSDDIALVRLDRPTGITPVCLPTEVVPIPQPALIVGWGKEGMYNKKRTCIKREGNSTILPKEECAKKGVDDFVIKDPKMICGGGSSVYPCQGDSGGPFLTKTDDGRYVIVGIVSWGYSCEVGKMPAIYSNVGYYKNWMYNIMYEKIMKQRKVKFKRKINCLTQHFRNKIKYSTCFRLR